MTAEVATLSFFRQLADEMNAHPERFEPLGDASMVVDLVLHTDGDGRRVRIAFDGIACSGVEEVDAGEEGGDFALVGDIEAWRSMFADIAAHGRATGPWTINSLALLGDRIACLGSDPMGLDRFSRFNQTLQEYFDGAGQVASTVGGRA